MAVEEKITCVGCPMGCLVTLTIEDGDVTAFEGNRCKQGETYTLEEYRNPVRVLTTTLRTSGSVQPLLPVRTSVPIPKTKLLETAAALAGMRVSPPVRMGDTVVGKQDGIAADIIATADLTD